MNYSTPDADVSSTARPRISEAFLADRRSHFLRIDSIDRGKCQLSIDERLTWIAEQTDPLYTLTVEQDGKFFLLVRGQRLLADQLCESLSLAKGKLDRGQPIFVVGDCVNFPDVLEPADLSEVTADQFAWPHLLNVLDTPYSGPSIQIAELIDRAACHDAPYWLAAMLDDCKYARAESLDALRKDGRPVANRCVELIEANGWGRGEEHFLLYLGEPEEIETVESLEITNAIQCGKTIKPLEMKFILNAIWKRCNGWPRRVGTSLFVHSGDEIHWLEKPAGLFAYVGTATGQPPRFHDVKGTHSRNEIFEALRQGATKYQSVEALPHEPRIDGHYYACGSVEPGDGKTLEKLLDRFSPETETDRDLLKLAFVTMFWGGYGGSRPAFAFTSDAGCGSGKSTAAQILAHFIGGSINLSTNETIEVIKQRLLSPDGATKRMALIDNIKSTKFSWSDLESLITAESISGKQLYVGERSRPNNLVFVMTLNGISMSTDMAQRSVVINFRKPEYSRNWDEDTKKLIDDYREILIGDCIAFLRNPQTEIKNFKFRFGRWANQVLCRLPHAQQAHDLILSRQNESDTDVEESDLVTDYFRSSLFSLGYKPREDRVLIPSAIVTAWFNAATNSREKSVSVGRLLRQKISEGKITCLADNPCRAYGRGLIWNGEASSPDRELYRDLDRRVELS